MNKMVIQDDGKILVGGCEQDDTEAYYNLMFRYAIPTINFTLLFNGNGNNNIKKIRQLLKNDVPKLAELNNSISLSTAQFIDEIIFTN